MILVTTGTHYLPFDRLVRAADELCEINREKVIIQIGCSNYIPKCAEHFRWTTNLELESLTKDARVVISQASAGAIILGLKLSKPIVMVPRKKRFGEHHDNHQQQLAKILAAQGRAVIVENPRGTNLSNAIGDAVQNLSQQTHDEKLLQHSLAQKILEWS